MTSCPATRATQTNADDPLLDRGAIGGAGPATVLGYPWEAGVAADDGTPTDPIQALVDPHPACGLRGGCSTGSPSPHGRGAAGDGRPLRADSLTWVGRGERTTLFEGSDRPFDRPLPAASKLLLSGGRRNRGNDMKKGELSTAAQAVCWYFRQVDLAGVGVGVPAATGDSATEHDRIALRHCHAGHLLAVHPDFRARRPDDYVADALGAVCRRLQDEAVGVGKVSDVSFYAGVISPFTDIVDE